MAAKLARIVFRMAIVAAVCVVGFYIGRPLYWKVTATLQDIRENNYTHEAVKHGFSDLMRDAQNSVGWGPGVTTWTGNKIEQERKPEPSKSKDAKKISTKGKKSGGPKANKGGSTARRLNRRSLRS